MRKKLVFGVFALFLFVFCLNFVFACDCDFRVEQNYFDYQKYPYVGEVVKVQYNGVGYWEESRIDRVEYKRYKDDYKRDWRRVDLNEGYYFKYNPGIGGYEKKKCYYEAPDDKLFYWRC